jgi:AcrR family transcriptional regulator
VRAILRAAAQVFATQGYAAGTTNHVAERAGVSIGTLYQYFPNKDALLIALMEEHLREGEAILAKTAAESVRDDGDLTVAVRRFVRAMVELHARERALHRVLFEEAPLPRAVRRQLADLERDVTTRVEGYLRTQPGVMRRDHALAAAIVVQAVEGITHKLVVHGEPQADAEAYVEELVALISAYLAAPSR